MSMQPVYVGSNWDIAMFMKADIQTGWFSDGLVYTHTYLCVFKRIKLEPTASAEPDKVDNQASVSGSSSLWSQTGQRRNQRR